MRNIYPRHRTECPARSRKDAQKHFSCGCPIYARVVIADPLTGRELFHHHGSLRKWNVTSPELANALIDSWTVRFLSGQSARPKKDPPGRTVAAAVEAYLEEKRRTLDPEKDSTSKTMAKISSILRPLADFLSQRGVHLLSDVRTEDLSAFGATRLGRIVRDEESGELRRLAKTQLGKQKDQEFLQSFFKRCRVLGWSEIDPAERLLPFKIPEQDVKPFSPGERKQLFNAIPRVFPKIAPMVRAFVLVQMYAALRLADVVTLSRASIIDGAVDLQSVRKNDQALFAELPDEVVRALQCFPPKSGNYYFWTGTCTIKTAVNDWSAKMTELYRAAGIKGKRTHEWRDTIGMDLLEDGATLEDVQMALAHKSRRTTERFYVRASRQRHRLANAAKRRLWAKDSFLKLISPEGGVEQPESTIPVRPTASNADGLPAD